MPASNKENFWASRRTDGHTRSHVPAMPMWTAFIRIAQLIVGAALVVLTAFAASRLGSGAAGFGLTWFTFALTLATVVYVGVTVLLFPRAYNVWAHVILEGLTCIFWLATWAVLASEASALNAYFGYGPSGIPGFDDRRRTNNNNNNNNNNNGAPYYYYSGGYPYQYTNVKPAIDCVKAAAGVGALEWVLFCVTLGALIAAMVAHRRHRHGTGAGVHVGSTGAEAGVGAETKAAPPVTSTTGPTHEYYAPPPAHANVKAGTSSAPYPGT